MSCYQRAHSRSHKQNHGCQMWTTLMLVFSSPNCRVVWKKCTEKEIEEFLCDGLKPFVIFSEKVIFFVVRCFSRFTRAALQWSSPRWSFCFFVLKIFRYYIVILLNWSNYYSFAFPALFISYLPSSHGKQQRDDEWTCRLLAGFGEKFM